jgi:hypothetical protein
MWARLSMLAVAVLALSGAAAASASQPVISLSFQDLGLVLSGQGLGFAQGTNLFSPSAAVLPDGRIRLYYSVITPNDAGSSGEYSAISTDGVHFQQEPGRRWPYTFEGSIRRLPDGRWRFYYAASPSGNSAGIASLISNDGLTFSDEAGLRLANPNSGRNLTCCGIVNTADGRYRMYVTSQYTPPDAPPGPAEVYSAVSSNLLDWTLEPGVRTLGVAPAARLDPSGLVLLAFTPGFGGIYTDSSTDGLTFAGPRQTDFTGNAHEATFADLPDGRLLVYYRTTNEPERGISSAIGALLASRLTAPSVSYPSPSSTDFTATSARVSAVIDPGGDQTSYAFDYGRSTAYDDSSGSNDVSKPRGTQTVTATLTDLKPATTYHFQAKAWNSLGTTKGVDQSFTTARCRAEPDHDRGYEVALAHGRTPAAAARTRRRAAKLLHVTPFVERDGCPDYETAVAGLTRKAATKLLRRAKKARFRQATLERT